MKQNFKEIIYSIASPVLSKVNKFYNIHRGESCYIFGDGVSLKFMDIKNFSDKEAIACNYIPLHNDFDFLNCSYCVACAPYMLSPVGGYEKTYKSHQRVMSKIYKNLIKKHQDKNFFLHLTNYPFVGGENVNFMFYDIPDMRLPKDYISRQTNCFSGALNTSILLAIYLGFEHIYLVGFDYTHLPSRSLHWYERGEGVFVPQNDYKKIFFDIALRYANIKTITLDGKSQFIDSITYKEFTGKEPEYLENSKLTDESNLQALATWSGYRIF